MTPADVPEPKPLTTVTIEHLRGKAIGGGSNYLNTAASCLECNSRRARQKAVGKRTVPRARVITKTIIEYTYVYTTPSKPDILVLANSTKNRDDALLEFRTGEGEPITLKHVTIKP